MFKTLLREVCTLAEQPKKILNESTVKASIVPETNSAPTRSTTKESIIPTNYSVTKPSLVPIAATTTPPVKE